jgi:zinc/manganese transport system permease protein
VSAVDPFTGLAHLLGLGVMRDALLAGTLIALACGVVGWFVVARAQVFTGDAMSHVAFTGTLGALVAGASLGLGLYGACIAAALVLAVVGRRGQTGQADDTVIGNLFAWVLGLGALFLTLYTTSSAGVDAARGVHVLFGSLLSISTTHAQVDALVGAGITVATLVLARPLVFATLDRAVASARGVRVGLLDTAFLVLVALAAAQATEAVGALLLLGLLSAPAGAAQCLTTRPFRGIALSAVIAVGSLWVGVALDFADSRIPPSFGVVATAGAVYAVALVAARLRRRAGAGLAVAVAESALETSSAVASPERTAPSM